MSSIFGQLPDGTAIQRLVLDSGAGLRAEVLTYGGLLRSLSLDTARGRTELVLGLPTLDAYLHDPAYLGVLVGRFGNRIAGSAFSVDGQRHALTANEGANHLHGGALGFGRRVWSVRAQSGRNLQLGYDSPAGEEGYPGNVQVGAEFSVHGRTLELQFAAQTDAPTPLNLTHHPYFNLAGDAGVAAAAQWLRVPADRYLPVADAALLPSGAIAGVAGTPFDFRTPRAIADKDIAADPQLRLSSGYDHCLVLADTRDCSAVLYSPHSGVAMRIASTAPALQLYEGQGLDRQHPQLGRGVCLEPQGYPDAPNQPGFPDTILRPGQVYRHRIEYRFADVGANADWDAVEAALAD
ncbi:galactose mutarotase [Xanthomonas sp. AM6]|uniref:aldose epimerase family protein n=1 Tax=Xanthomonas sp. AM6 TaxID=2982531 RepID=UPI0021DAEA44|nr:aldose epimerase family protein [Xanthomonas sp. AM6]UYB51089.1 galactose mutarotase [Xanthomonas sp. AM6]